MRVSTPTTLASTINQRPSHVAFYTTGFVLLGAGLALMNTINNSASTEIPGQRFLSSRVLDKSSTTPARSLSLPTGKLTGK